MYISGAISSELETAPQKFADAELRVQRTFGCQTINPMTLPHKEGATWEEYMAVDLLELMKCDAIYMLPCWEKSPGAQLELAMARQLEMKIIYEVE